MYAKRINKIISVIMMIVMALSFSAAAADSQIYSSTYFRKADASLTASSSLRLSYEVVTNNSVSKLGISSITLYDITTGNSSSYSGTTASGKSKSGTVTLRGAVKGHRYYATVTFCALDASGNGLTTDVDTDSITF